MSPSKRTHTHMAGPWRKTYSEDGKSITWHRDVTPIYFLGESLPGAIDQPEQLTLFDYEDLYGYGDYEPY